MVFCSLVLFAGKKIYWPMMNEFLYWCWRSASMQNLWINAIRSSYELTHNFCYHPAPLREAINKPSYPWTNEPTTAQGHADSCSTHQPNPSGYCRNIVLTPKKRAFFLKNLRQNLMRCSRSTVFLWKYCGLQLVRLSPCCRTITWLLTHQYNKYYPKFIYTWTLEYSSKIAFNFLV